MLLLRRAVAALGGRGQRSRWRRDDCSQWTAFGIAADVTAQAHTASGVARAVRSAHSFGASAGPEASRAIFEAFTAAGGTTFDTSNLYQDGQAETVLGELLGAGRDDFVVITRSRDLTVWPTRNAAVVIR